ncbi:Vacuolar protein sorting-associated protein 8 [Boothiomyces sp. JEL0838]|nr:Vacuolar protein sorting-associated protein 8 [Boothiomyces sp. JEL0838]
MELISESEDEDLKMEIISKPEHVNIDREIPEQNSLENIARIEGLYLKALIPEMQLIDTPKQDLIETCTYLENLQKLIIQQDSDQGILLLERIGRDISLYQHFIKHNESELQEDISFADTSILSGPSRRGSTLGLKHSSSRLSLKTTGTVPEMKDLQDEQLNTIPPGPTGIFRWSSFRELSLHLFENFKPTVFAVSSGIAVGTLDSKTVLYDLAQNHLATLQSPQEYGAVTALDICPDQTQVIIGFQSGHISLWDIRKRVLVKTIDPVDGGDGHLKGIAITHLAFNSRDVFYSANQQGAAYYHILYKRLVYSTFKSYRIHGRLKAPDEPDLINTTIYSMSPLLKGKVKFPGDSLSLVAVTSPFKLAILSMKPSPRIQHRIMWSSLNNEHAVEYSCTRWWVPTSNKYNSKRLPRLAFSFGRKLGVINLSSTMESAEDQSKKLVFNVACQTESESDITAIEWINSQFILCLTSDAKFEIYDSSNLKKIESVLISTHKPIENSWETSIPKVIPLHPSPQHNISSNFNRLFIMTDKEICFGSLLSWQDRLAVLIRTGNFKMAFQYGIALFEGEYPIVVLGVPVDKEEREQIVADHLSGLILNLTSMSLSGISNQEDPSIYYDTAKLIIDTCISINKLDLIFGDIFERFVDVSLFSIFNDILQNLILNGTITSVPNPQIIQLMFENLKKENTSQLEQVLMLLDPKIMDLHNTIRLCKQWGFTNALIHVYNSGLMEFGLPVLEIIEKIDKKEGDGAQDLYTLFVYLAYILQGKAFPFGILEEDVANIAYKSIFGILCSPSFVLFEDSELKAGKEPWPYLFFLLEKDTMELLKVMGAVFDNSVLNSGISLQDDKHKDSLLITRHYIINVFLHLIESYSWSQLQLDAIYSFIARSYNKYRVYMNISKKKLMEIFNSLIDSQINETTEERQIAVISLYEGGFIPERQESDKDRFLERFKEAKFWKLYENSVLETGQYDLAIESYIADVNRKPSVFASIRKWISEGKQETVSLIKSTVQKRLPDLLDDTHEIVKLYEDLWANEHQDNIELLKDNPPLQYKYIGGLIGFKKSNGASTPLYGKFLFDKYLELMCEIQPKSILKYLKWLDDIYAEEPYHLELVTSLCSKYKLNRVTIWLLEKSRNYVEAVDLYLEIFLVHLSETNSTLLDQPPHSDETTLKKQKQKSYGMLNDIIRICELDIKNHLLWFKILDRICFALEETTDFLKDVKTLAMEACIAHLPVPKILIHLIESQPKAEFGKYRQLITHLLETTAYQKQTLEIALTLTNSFGFELYHEYIQKCKSSFHPSLGQCQLCRRLFHIKAMTIQEQQDKVCHHAFHSTCLVSALEKAQKVYGQDSFEDYELWCIICGKPSQVKFKGKQAEIQYEHNTETGSELTKFEKVEKYLEGKPKMSEIYNSLVVTLSKSALDEIQMNDSFLEEE